VLGRARPALVLPRHGSARRLPSTPARPNPRSATGARPVPSARVRTPSRTGGQAIPAAVCARSPVAAGRPAHRAVVPSVRRDAPLRRPAQAGSRAPRHRGVPPTPDRRVPPPVPRPASVATAGGPPATVRARTAFARYRARSEFSQTSRGTLHGSSCRYPARRSGISLTVRMSDRRMQGSVAGTRFEAPYHVVTCGHDCTGELCWLRAGRPPDPTGGDCAAS
jgi:hypothetical protein